MTSRSLQSTPSYYSKLHRVAQKSFATQRSTKNRSCQKSFAPPCTWRATGRLVKQIVYKQGTRRCFKNICSLHLIFLEFKQRHKLWNESVGRVWKKRCLGQRMLSPGSKDIKWGTRVSDGNKCRTRNELLMYTAWRQNPCSRDVPFFFLVLFRKSSYRSKAAPL